MTETKQTPGAASSPASPDAQSSTQPRILMVDDDDMQLEFYEAVLSSEYEVLTASDIGTAGLLLEDQQVDAVACDLHCGAASGLDLLSWIQAHQPGLLRRCMILSGAPTARPGGFDVRVMGKPVDPDCLKQAFTALLEQYSEAAS